MAEISSILAELERGESVADDAAEERERLRGELIAAVKAGGTTGDRITDMSIRAGFGYERGRRDLSAFVRTLDERLRAGAGQFVLDVRMDGPPARMRGGCFGSHSAEFGNEPRIESARFAILDGNGLVAKPDDPSQLGISCVRYVSHSFKDAKRETIMLDGPMYPSGSFTDPIPYIFLLPDLAPPVDLGYSRSRQALLIGDERIGDWIAQDTLGERRPERWFWAGVDLGRVPLQDPFVRYFAERKLDERREALTKASSEREQALNERDDLNRTIDELDGKVRALKDEVRLFETAASSKPETQ